MELAFYHIPETLVGTRTPLKIIQIQNVRSNDSAKVNTYI